MFLVARESFCYKPLMTEALFCISDRTTSTYLRSLTEAGKLKRQSTGRETFYTHTS